MQRTAKKVSQGANAGNKALQIMDYYIDNPDEALQRWGSSYINNVKLKPDFVKRFARGLAEKLANSDGETELFAMFSAPKKQESKPIIEIGSVDIYSIGKVKVYLFGDLVREYGQGNRGEINLDLNDLARGFSWNYSLGLIGKAGELYEKRDKLKRVYITRVSKEFLARHPSVDYIGSVSVLGDKLNLRGDFSSVGKR